MDKLRVALVTAFALVTFMLVIEYGKFKDEKDKARILAEQENQPEPFLEFESSSDTLSDSGEIPVVMENKAVQEKTRFSQSDAKNILVETDTFKIQINPKGGDLDYVALKKHSVRLDTPDIPFQILENNEKRVYIAQSGLIGQNGTDKSLSERPLFSSESKTYRLAEDKDSLVVDLFYQQGSVEITKRFTFKKDSYLIGIDYLINNQGDSDWTAGFYGQIKRDGSADPATKSGTMGMAPYLGFATSTIDERFKKIDFEDIQEKAFEGSSIQGGWIAMIQHYFLSAWVPNQDVTNKYSTVYSKSGFYLGRIQSPLVTIKAGEQGSINNSFYVGPKDQYTLEDYSEGLDLSVDYGWLWFIAQPLYALLYFFNQGTLHAFGQEMTIFGGLGNWGFSIILLTICVKLLFFGLNKKAYTSMAKMRAIQPKMLEIRDQYADDRQKQSQEMMALYSKEGVNPVGGCLPMLLQMPVFIALYWVLLESVELRHAPFIGYIKDLSAMDPYFIMPLIMGASMFFQQKLNPPPPDPMQAKVMQMLPIIFTFFFLFFPSGLVLYWVVNNILSIAQQWVITKRLETQGLSVR